MVTKNNKKVLSRTRTRYFNEGNYEYEGDYEEEDIGKEMRRMVINNAL